MIKILFKHLAIAAGAAFFILAPSPKIFAQAALTGFSFDNFTGTYYLDRDAKGVATVTVQEDMIIEFGAGGNLYGIKRSVTNSYQGHNLNLKIISLTDALGNPLPYKAYPDNKGNTIVQTGNPAIILSGQQTYRLKYQTSGVAAFYSDHDEFLVDTNGRGWQESFGQVQAFIHVAPSFAANLLGQPSCYIGTTTQNLGNCTTKQQTTANDTLISSVTTKPLGANQALVTKIDFKKGTFNQIKDKNGANKLLLIIFAPALIAFGLWIVYRQIQRRAK